MLNTCNGATGFDSEVKVIPLIKEENGETYVTL
jgi:hypothetical protein